MGCECRIESEHAEDPTSSRGKEEDGERNFQPGTHFSMLTKLNDQRLEGPENWKVSDGDLLSARRCNMN
jgi:hypothetical protein